MGRRPNASPSDAGMAEGSTEYRGIARDFRARGLRAARDAGSQLGGRRPSRDLVQHRRNRRHNGWWRGSTHGNYVVLHWTSLLLGNHHQADSRCNEGVHRDEHRRSATPTSDRASRAPRLRPSPDVNGWKHRLHWPRAGRRDLRDCKLHSGPTRALTAPRQGNRHCRTGVNVTSARLTYDPTVAFEGRVTSRAAKSDLVRWTSTSAADTAVVQRWARGNSAQPVVFRGSGSSFVDKKIQVGLEYVYAIQTTDQAGNASKRVTVTGLPKMLTLDKMAYIPRTAPNPILRWQRCTARATTTSSCSAGRSESSPRGPRARQLALPTTWKWAGHRYRLKPGKYRWYAWAGIGRRSFAKYDRIGSARFIVPPG